MESFEIIARNLPLVVLFTFSKDFLSSSLSFRRTTRAKLNGKNLTCPDKLFFRIDAELCSIIDEVLIN